MAATKQKTKNTAQIASHQLSEVAQRIAQEVTRGNKKGQQTTLRDLLERCGYEKRNAPVLKRLTAALDAVGVQCLPPVAGVGKLDDTIRLQSAAIRKNGNGGAEKVVSKSTRETTKAAKVTTKRAVPSKLAAKAAAKTKKTEFSSLEEMLLHARRATVLIKLADGHGSGLVIDETGLVLTARHVVEDSETVCIRFEDGTQCSGRVVFSDIALDYAFVQGEPRADFFTLHNNMRLSVGQTVYAVGTPMQADLAGSVSRGIISSLDRVIGGVNYIQTDATIHAGHSGGPLLTKDGDVVGVNLWGRPEEGIRFALPMPYILGALHVLQPQLNDLEARLYCADCGFLNGLDSWLLCSSWVCCGHCGTVLGDTKAEALETINPCEGTERENLQADRAQLARAKSEATL